jgi:acetyltransferase-like isoleucine patch superfamily enzyme
MNKFKIGKNSTINCNSVEIDDSVVIGNNVKIKCESIKIGKFSQIGNNVNINCRNLDIGTWLFVWDGVEIGRGGCNGPNSNVKIGNRVGIFENTIINPSESVEIGDDTGIGSEVMIWTHGAWLDVLQGFPADFGPVKIGSNVWLPARNIVLPNVTIGDNSVIGIGSIVNRDIPEGSLAAGSPCKVIKENYYPKPLSATQQKKLIWEIIEDWYKLHEDKDIKDVKTKYDDGKIILVQQNYETIYYIEERKIEGYINNISEDLRDYLRRRGIKIYTDRLFKSI